MLRGDSDFYLSPIIDAGTYFRSNVFQHFDTYERVEGMLKFLRYVSVIQKVDADHSLETSSFDSLLSKCLLFN